MVAAQPGQHRLIPVGVEEDVQNDVAAVIKRIAGDLIDQPDVPRAGTVPFLEDDPARDEILGEPGISGPQAAHSALATVLLPDPELPRRTTSRVCPDPTANTRDPKRGADGYIGYTVGVVA
jgi:hypothetical protein